MKRYILALSLILTAFMAHAETDSVRVERLLAESLKQPDNTCWMTWFARKMLGVPYVGGTLDYRYANDRNVINGEDPIITNTKQLDCYTYVEMCTALTFCRKYHQKTFPEYRNWIRCLRYYSGHASSYDSRLHYFSQWIDEHTRTHHVTEIQMNGAPFTAQQTLELTVMSKYPNAYSALTNHPLFIQEIEKREKELTGQVKRYIPRAQLGNTAVLRNAVHNGDILAIVTNKRGIDVSHVGIAIWHKDGLHLLNASSIHKKTVEEPMTLQQYMSRHPNQAGIRVVRVNY